MDPPQPSHTVISLPHALDLRTGIHKLKDGKYSDFLITCGAREWKAHAIILGSISPVLETACYGGFKENIESKLDLSAWREIEVDALITFIYTGRYYVPQDNTSTLAVPFHANMCIIGDYFSISSLVSYATDRAKSAMGLASLEEIVEAAAISASAPDPTKGMCGHIVEYAVKLHNLYDGEDCPFDKLVAANTDFGKEIAMAERASLSAGRSGNGPPAGKGAGRGDHYGAYGSCFPSNHPLEPVRGTPGLWQGNQR